MDLTSKEDVCKIQKKDYVTPKLKVVKIEQQAMLLDCSGDDCTFEFPDSNNG